MSEKKKGDELLDRSDVFEEIQLPKLDCNRRGSRIIEDEHGSFQSYSSGERESNVVPVTSTDNLKGVIIMVISCCCFGAMGFL